jgi:CDP-glycerol glycerophosphotransferase
VPDSIGDAVTRLPHRAARAALARMQRRWRSQPLDHDAVLFESFGGQRISCNPRALYEGMRDDPRFADRRFVWAVAEGDVAAASGLAPDSRLSFVRMRSRAYFRALARSGTLITNVTFPVSFVKRPDQIYVNTWHGTPLKKMGRDVPDGDPVVLADTVANLSAADLLLSTGPYMTDVMYAGAYGITGPSIQELGYPRVDEQFDPAVRAAVRALLGGSAPIVLYAPTWRQATDTVAADDTDEIARRVTELAALVEPAHRVVVRLHDKAMPAARTHPELASRLAPEEVSTNALLGVADTLITDYSSVFFDYLATGHRLVFWMPDREAYSSLRGMYLDVLPGVVCRTAGEVAAAVAAPADPEVMAAARERYAPDDDGRATGRVLDAILARQAKG